ncbi:MAG: hypothetical protein ACK4SZ_13810 [Allosphingosinicella sp.]|uniref:hypothetical protein n=1 Tax=Allosphingosinicella sp. TaxID=2823234 RepID=UPI00392A8E1D
MKGGLADDEMRALMDPAFDEETQAALGGLATARAQLVPQAGSGTDLPVSSADEDFEWLQRLRAHQQGGGGIGGR